MCRVFLWESWVYNFLSKLLNVLTEIICNRKKKLEDTESVYKNGWVTVAKSPQVRQMTRAQRDRQRIYALNDLEKVCKSENFKKLKQRFWNNTFWNIC